MEPRRDADESAGALRPERFKGRELGPLDAFKNIHGGGS